jgi:hypothetical protein
MKKKQQVIDFDEQRHGLFMNKKSYDLEIFYGREYIKNDINQWFNLYRVNILETKTHSLYSQSKAKDIQYFPPIRLNAMIEVGESTQNYYGDSKGIVRDDVGKIEISIYLKELEERNIEINRGDIIEYNISGDKNRYWEVDNANNVTDTTNNTIAGFKPYMRKITGVPVKEDIVKFIKERK